MRQLEAPYTSRPMDIQQITGTARKVSQLLANTRYGLDYYQREYNWKKAQVESLIDDLTDRFRSEFDPTHERPDVESYRPYFLGPIVTVERGGVRYLVDGQQRITTLSLLLIYLRHALADTHSDELSSLDSLIFSTRYGRKTFNLDVEERDRCLRAILNGEDYDTRRAASVSTEHLQAIRHDPHSLPRRSARQGTRVLLGLASGQSDFRGHRGPQPGHGSGDLRDHERPGPAAEQHRHAQELPALGGARRDRDRRPQHTLATSRHRLGRLRGERRRGVCQGLAARQLRADPAPAQVEGRTPRLRDHRHGLPQVGSRKRRQHRPLSARRLPALRRA